MCSIKPPCIQPPPPPPCPPTPPSCGKPFDPFGMPKVIPSPPQPIDCKPAPIDCKPAPIDCKPAPIDCKPAPIDCKPAPKEECKPAPKDDCKDLGRAIHDLKRDFHRIEKKLDDCLPSKFDPAKHCGPELPKADDRLPAPKFDDCHPSKFGRVELHGHDSSKSHFGRSERGHDKDCRPELPKFSDFRGSDWGHLKGCRPEQPKFSDFRGSDWGHLKDCRPEMPKFSDFRGSDWGHLKDCRPEMPKFTDFSKSDWAHLKGDSCGRPHHGTKVDIKNDGCEGSVRFGNYDFKFSQADSTFSMTDRRTGETTKVWGDPHITNPNGKTTTNYGDYTFHLPDGTMVTFKTVTDSDAKINECGRKVGDGVSVQNSWTETVTITNGKRTVVVDNLHNTDGKGLSMTERRGGSNAGANTTDLIKRNGEWHPF